MESHCGADTVRALPATAALRNEGGRRALKLEDQIAGLFDEMQGPLYRYLLSLSVNSAEADEIVQETFLRLYKHLTAGGREDNLRGWLFRVARNISVTEFRKRNHRPVANEDYWVEATESNADPARNPEELLVWKESMARVHAAISELSGQQKECLYLRAEGFRYREIAEILDVTTSTVVEYLRRAINKLAKEAHE